MTKTDLQIERAMEKARARVVQSEINRIKRVKVIKEHFDTILDFMTAIVLSILVVIAFVIDAYGAATIPAWVYTIGIAYLILYVFVLSHKFKEK
jgi:hypothetical protein